MPTCRALGGGSSDYMRSIILSVSAYIDHHTKKIQSRLKAEDRAEVWAEWNA